MNNLAMMCTALLILESPFFSTFMKFVFAGLDARRKSAPEGGRQLAGGRASAANEHHRIAPSDKSCAPGGARGSSRISRGFKEALQSLAGGFRAWPSEFRDYGLSCTWKGSPRCGLPAVVCGGLRRSAIPNANGVPSFSSGVAAWPPTLGKRPAGYQPQRGLNRRPPQAIRDVPAG